MSMFVKRSQQSVVNLFWIRPPHWASAGGMLWRAGDTGLYKEVCYLKHLTCGICEALNDHRRAGLSSTSMYVGLLRKQTLLWKGTKVRSLQLWRNDPVLKTRAFPLASVSSGPGL